MLYTGKGDEGTTSLCNAAGRVAKNAKVIEALGSVDELNAWLGLCKARAAEKKRRIILNELQEDLFVIQAQVAGADKKLSSNRVGGLEGSIKEIEQKLPQINTFLIAGSSEESALFDVARTIARRAERRLVEAVDSEGLEVGVAVLAYLNRLSSLLYAMARLASAQAGIKEERPSYFKG